MSPKTHFWCNLFLHLTRKKYIHPILSKIYIKILLLIIITSSVKNNGCTLPIDEFPSIVHITNKIGLTMWSPLLKGCVSAKWWIFRAGVKSWLWTYAVCHKFAQFIIKIASVKEECIVKRGVKRVIKGFLLDTKE